MKIKGTHSVCGREVLVQQIIENGGHCPWDGLPFNKDYTALLADALELAELAGSTLEKALDDVAEMHGTLSLDRASVLVAIEGRVAATQQTDSKKARVR